MKKKLIIGLSILSIIIIILGVFLAKKNKSIINKSIEIIDATYICDNQPEHFFEDDTYIYYFPCTKSNTLYIKYPNGNKYLLTKALEEEKVTLKQLIDSGLDVIKEKNNGG